MDFSKFFQNNFLYFFFWFSFVLYNEWISLNSFWIEHCEKLRLFRWRKKNRIWDLVSNLFSNSFTNKCTRILFRLTWGRNLLKFIQIIVQSQKCHFKSSLAMKVLVAFWSFHWIMGQEWKISWKEYNGSMESVLFRELFFWTN